MGVTKTMEVDELKEKLNQFISNHIRPSEIISDNARTFGAMAKWIKKIRTSEKLHAFLAKEEITWRFNLSKAPWWGVMYETNTLQSNWQDSSHPKSIQKGHHGHSDAI